MEAGLKGGAPAQGLLGESDAFDGESLLGVDGLVGGHGFGVDVGEGIEFFEADDGEVGGGEAVLAGILSGAGLAFGGGGAGGLGGVYAVSGGALFGDGFGGLGHRTPM